MKSKLAAFAPTIPPGAIQIEFADDAAFIEYYQQSVARGYYILPDGSEVRLSEAEILFWKALGRKLLLWIILTML